MKTKTKTKKSGKPERQQTAPRRSIKDRGLNEDDQNRVTNASASEGDEDYQRISSGDDVDAEEEREKKRQVDDARGEEEN